MALEDGVLALPEISDGGTESGFGVFWVDTGTGLAMFTDSSNNDYVLTSEISGLTDNHLVRADGTDSLQDSGIICDDSDNLTGVQTIVMDGNFDLNGQILILDADQDSFIDGSVDDVVGIAAGTAAGVIQFLVNGAVDITISEGSLNIPAGTNVAVANTSWYGLGAAAGRIRFVDATPDYLQILDCDLAIDNGNSVRLYEPTGGGASYVELYAPALAASYSLSLPATSTTGALSNAAGTLSWKAYSGLDATIVTGTAGVATNLAVWDANGDIIDGGAVPSVGGTHRQFFSVSEFAYQIGNFGAIRPTGTNNRDRVNFFVPAEASSLDAVYMVVIPAGNDATADVDLSSNYAASGEAYTTHAETDAASTYNLVQNQVQVIDVTAKVFNNLAPGDEAALEVDDNTGASVLRWIGVIVEYTI